MNDEQLLRYSRHLLLTEFGVEGQERLRAAHALVIGAGGLGCPASLYLAASGIGRLTIADADRVDLTNLQRQILYRTDSVGMTKVDAARTALAALNPEVELITLQKRLHADDLPGLVARADIVLDCSDNFATRHALNRACVTHRKALVSGAGIRFDGQIAVFDLRREGSACYHCLFGEDSGAAEERCATMGVFAPLVGIIGTFQAAEAVKLVAGIGETLAGRLMLFDALASRWHEVRLARDPQCRVCAEARVAA